MAGAQWSKEHWVCKTELHFTVLHFYLHENKDRSIFTKVLYLRTILRQTYSAFDLISLPSYVLEGNCFQLNWLHHKAPIIIFLKLNFEVRTFTYNKGVLLHCGAYTSI